MSRRALRAAATGLTLSLGAAIATPCIAAAQALTPGAPAPSTLGPSVAPLVDRVKDSVVTIQATKVVRRMIAEDPWTRTLREYFGGPGGPRVQQERQEGLGSGFIVDAHGTVFTNNHVVAGADEVRVALSDDRRFEARVIGRDPRTDVAVIKIKSPPRDLRPVVFGDSERLRVGDYVLAIGNPLGLGQTVTMGIVSGKNRMLGGRILDYEDFIQTDAAINQGNSGGPLFNFQGEVVGINSAILNPAAAMNVGFAIPINLARRIANQIQRGGRVARGYLGVRTEDLASGRGRAQACDAEAGAVVVVAEENAPASRSGVRAGDVILAVGGRRVDGSVALSRVVGSRSPGETVAVALCRGGKRLEVQVRLEENPRLTGTRILGMEVRPLEPAAAARLELPAGAGLVVVQVEPGGLASGALIEGDVIRGIDRSAATLPLLQQVERRLAVGGAARLIVWRDGYEFAVTLQ